MQKGEDAGDYDRQYVCYHGCVYNSALVSETTSHAFANNDTVLSTSCTIDLHVRGEGDELPKTERYLLSSLDGDGSGGVKRIPKALAVENDQWVDWFDVSGSERSWYEENGDVVAVYRV